MQDRGFASANPRLREIPELLGRERDRPDTTRASTTHFTDFFVIATGRNARQTKAIYDEVAGVLKKEHELLPRNSAGAAEATWIVADYLDVVLHLFTPDTRAFYRLEELWSDVPSVELEAATA